MFTSDKEGKEIDDILEDVKKSFDKRMQDGTISERDVGFYRGDIKKNE